MEDQRVEEVDVGLRCLKSGRWEMGGRVFIGAWGLAGDCDHTVTKPISDSIHCVCM